MLILLLGIIGVSRNYHKLKEKHIQDINEYESQLALFKEDSIKYLQSISAPINQVSFRKSSASEAYLSASQGIEAHLKGLNWRGYFIDNGQDVLEDIRTSFDAYYRTTIDKIEFDPDFENCGYPDLIVEIKSSPSFYQPSTLSKYLGKSEPKPYKSYKLNSCDKRKATMDLWLVSFDLTFRIEPNFKHNRNNEFSSDKKHPITQKPIHEIRGQREYKDMRYDRLSVLLEFKPKNFYYLSSEPANPLAPLNESPKIGIGAVECIYFEKVGEGGENNKAVRLGVELEKGKSLPLYPDMESLLNQISWKRRSNTIFNQGEPQEVESQVSAYENITDICEDGKIIADPDFFNKPKYSLVDIKNLGSWKQEKSWFLGETEYKADYFHVKFLVHLYVLGEWVVKDENLSKFKPRPPASITKPGLFDYLLPDFNLGVFGKVLSIILLPLILILLFSFFFPSIRVLVNRIIMRIIKI
jgi:hypothetical protein